MFEGYRDVRFAGFILTLIASSAKIVFMIELRVLSCSNEEAGAEQRRTNDTKGNGEGATSKQNTPNNFLNSTPK